MSIFNFTKDNVEFEWGSLDYKAKSEPNAEGLLGVIYRIEWRYKGTVIIPGESKYEPMINQQTGKPVLDDDGNAIMNEIPQNKRVSVEKNGIVTLSEPNPMTFVEIETLMANKVLFRQTLINWLETIYNIHARNEWKDSIYNQLQSKINPSIIVGSV